MKKLAYKKISHIYNLILAFAFTLCSALCSCSPSHDTEYPELSALDSLIEQHDEFNKEKLVRISSLRNKLNNSVSPTDKYMANSLLYDEFATYQADSAMKYADRNIMIAEQVGNAEWEAKSKIKKSTLLAATGFLAESADVMASIDRATLPSQLLVDYYGQMIFLYSHMGNYAGGSENEFYVRERAYKDSVMSVIDETHPEYLWYKGWDVLGTKKDGSEVIAALKKRVDNSSLDTRQDAKDAYILAKLYEEIDDTDNLIKYMAKSAMSDVRIVNAEISSLEDLSMIEFDHGDIDHAYDYINYSLNKAIQYPNRVKAISISRTLDTIYNAYQEKELKQQERMRQFLILVCVLAAVLIVSTIIIIQQNSKLKKQGRTLDEANKRLSQNNTELSQAQTQLNEANTSLNEANAHLNEANAQLNEANDQLNIANTQLKELNADLKEKNEELNEANYVKEEYIGYVFTICSSYISKMESLRRNIHVKILAKKYREIADETANIDMKDELRDFYKSFDSIFLHIYPNFVNDFNTLLQEDKRIYPKEGELLNTELRIYALVRLGITDSVKIAEFLHCSPQTVYNNRFKVRNKAIISKKEFADTVRTLGTYLERTS